MSETNHDSHYQKIKKELGIEPVDAGEYLAGKDCIPRVPAKHLGTATEYLLRAGDKGDWRADARKALNHIHRALYGFWMPVEINVEQTEVSAMPYNQVRDLVRRAIDFGFNHRHEGNGIDADYFIQKNLSNENLPRIMTMEQVREVVRAAMHFGHIHGLDGASYDGKRFITVHGLDK